VGKWVDKGEFLCM